MEVRKLLDLRDMNLLEITIDWILVSDVLNTILTLNQNWEIMSDNLLYEVPSIIWRFGLYWQTYSEEVLSNVVLKAF